MVSVATICKDILRHRLVPVMAISGLGGLRRFLGSGLADAVIVILPR